MVHEAAGEPVTTDPACSEQRDLPVGGDVRRSVRLVSVGSPSGWRTSSVMTCDPFIVSIWATSMFIKACVLLYTVVLIAHQAPEAERSQAAYVLPR
ncbi:hypothetical protein O9H85_07220 [Paenibacillus filicis]|uniref:Uncharacterized protein n=1 Tax=Paenibacillus gyeongsangnamensis TaxID=3388067 RepID=A0ABT4Q5S9_9BACL|nr:hypothetical protein [Paenibacillus filicis]MCZ8512220.1 hypothetical protein [Paenibacillus filicis]